MNSATALPRASALEAARHSLIALTGLRAFDAAAPGETFEIDESAVIAQLDEAITPPADGELMTAEWTERLADKIDGGLIVMTPCERGMIAASLRAYAAQTKGRGLIATASAEALSTC